MTVKPSEMPMALPMSDEHESITIECSDDPSRRRLVVDGKRVHIPTHAELTVESNARGNGLVALVIRAANIKMVAAGMRTTPRRPRKHKAREGAEQDQQQSVDGKGTEQ